ncbi:MAG: polysaccharide deacetylase family protein [Lachnospiraceae bacterium]|nr:polysaccharide deacetylase family protein [Lachnospiraceae bacterium]
MWEKIRTIPRMAVFHNKTFYKTAAIVVLLLGICICAYIGSRKDEVAEVGNMYGDRKLPIYCVETEEKVIALSFDAAWGNEDTQEILDILERQDVKVTFFMTGGWVEAYPEDVKKIYEAGHELGNHSENHLNMSELSMSEIEEEIMLVHNRVKELTGYDMCVFRPPYGDYDNDVITGVENCGYYAIQWDVDTLYIKVMTI